DPIAPRTNLRFFRADPLTSHGNPCYPILSQVVAGRGAVSQTPPAAPGPLQRGARSESSRVALFLSRFDNKVDRKGRVSVPAPFRAQLSQQAFHGIIAYPSPVAPAIEGCGRDRIEQIA